MKALLQKVNDASVAINGRVYSRIGRGLLVFLCVVRGDTVEDVNYLCKKIPVLRVFDDPSGRMNLSIKEIGGELLVVSQFTLAARLGKGKRLSFDNAESSGKAREMYKLFTNRLTGEGLPVSTGIFGEYMEISLTNAGPVTILVDSREKKPQQQNHKTQTGDLRSSG
ncbi:D-tyrosyl-tRNA(Tyr) deacylase [bacterium BMS3Bbin06]|nr:D-tyrosyl-tRNA(Tyr) deacylase [bacterium BMS3Abin08]GBE33691.1 D-tyrosyl-tRNA(Tyr) deacylase [bacterium BMS3Bbin06]HDO36586.1 D-tyrosyl-tRNA(Tyr) deacylase [Nitrospirota bacterium]HDY71024.1 D-tyrosyl-tRNA(Tyr) deacylase [Nitrospirota bacterium]